jgi:acid stress-induced BolA-like protein IbaG/YrbA
VRVRHKLSVDLYKFVPRGVTSSSVSDHPTDFQGSIPDAITTSIQAKLADAKVEVSGGGGHWSIVVVSTAFAGKSLLESQRMVLSAIKHLINGAAPPIHAVDSLITKTP